MTAPTGGAPESWDALVLAGGAASRLGGVDKAGVVVGGRALLDRVLVAAGAAGRLVVVGPRREVGRGVAGCLTGEVRWVREDPPGGGPVAGIAAGVGQVSAPLVAVLAVDMPFLSAEWLAALCRATAVPGVEVALLCDPDGRWQPLAAVWRTAALRLALGGAGAAPAGRSVRGLLAGRVVAPVPAAAATCLDCDSPRDVETARQWAAGGGRAE
jgi:molybdopterin-guanine dinucleotide biosynthesis protein A